MKSDEIKLIRLMLDDYMEGKGVFHMISKDLAENNMAQTAEATRDKFGEYHAIWKKFDQALDDWEVYGQIDDPEVLLKLTEPNSDNSVAH